MLVSWEQWAINWSSGAFVLNRHDSTVERRVGRVAVILCCWSKACPYSICDTFSAQFSPLSTTGEQFHQPLCLQRSGTTRLCIWFLANSMPYLSLTGHFFFPDKGTDGSWGKMRPARRHWTLVEHGRVAHGGAEKGEQYGKEAYEASPLFSNDQRRNEKKGKGFWKRQREKGRATEIAPAGAVCWEQVVYLGQHIASSAFLPTCLSKWRRGQPARWAALLRVSASALNILSTVHAVSHTVQCVHWLKPAVPNALYIYTLSPASSSSRQTCTHTCADPRAVSNPYKHCVSLEEMMTYA